MFEPVVATLITSMARTVTGARSLWLGCAPTASPSGATVPTPDALTRRVLDVLRPLELGPVLTERVVLTPACGLAGWAAAQVTSAVQLLGRVAGRLDEAAAR